MRTYIKYLRKCWFSLNAFLFWAFFMGPSLKLILDGDYAWGYGIGAATFFSLPAIAMFFDRSKELSLPQFRDQDQQTPEDSVEPSQSDVQDPKN